MGSDSDAPPAKKAPLNMPMKAVVWKGPLHVEVARVERPVLKSDKDVIVKVELTTICGSDLSLYRNIYNSSKPGDILGHECMGFIEEAGAAVAHKFKKGQRVVVSAIVSCGTCEYCLQKEYSLCETTGPVNDKLCAGFKTSGILGYSELKGGYDGVQAQYVRVPFADVNVFPVPDGPTNEQVLFLSDVYATAWHANELGHVKPGDTVAVWGLGPIGMMTLYWAKHRGAVRVIGIDGVEDRLSRAKSIGCEVIDFMKHDVTSKLLEMVPGGPSVCIDCVGLIYSKKNNVACEAECCVSKAPKNMPSAKKITSATSQAILSVKKNGRVVLIGVYVGDAQDFPIGALIDKGATITGSHVHVQKYWEVLFSKVQAIDPNFLISHKFKMDDAPEAYRIFNDKASGAFKTLIKPWE